MKWISTKDKLPPENKRVLLIVADKPYRNEHMVICGNRFSNENVPSGFQLDDDSVDDMLSDKRQIIAWMDLPDTSNFDFSLVT